MASKRYKGKDCAYCGAIGASRAPDHVIAREFFLEGDRGNLPQVPACDSCNNMKSALEHYATAVLMAGTNHLDGDLYRKTKVVPRIQKNRKYQKELGLNDPPVWINIRGVIQQMHVIKIDADKINALMAMIVRGLYFFHFARPLAHSFEPDISMFHPHHEPVMLHGLSIFFPADAPRVRGDLGRGGFVYEGIQSPAHEALTLWRMIWHGGIRLHGENSPPDGVEAFWGVTRPTPEALAALVQAGG
jgi:hypothetical protein